MSVLRVEASGLRATGERLAALPDAIEKAAMAALNRQIMATKYQQIIAPAAAATGIRQDVLSRRMPVRKAQQRNLSATLLVSSAGIPVTEYRWWHEPVGRNPTRHRVMVAWPGGAKVASGFVNPLGKRGLPLTTRLKGRQLAPALGPSAAALRMAVYGPGAEGETLNQFYARLAALIADVADGRPVPNA